MLIANQTDYTSPEYVKYSNYLHPLTVYVRGATNDNDVSGGSVTIEILGEDGDWHAYDDTIITSASITRLHLHYKAQYRVVVAGMTNPVDVEIR